MKRRAIASFFIAAAITLNGCMSTRQSALDATGIEARSILHLWWFFLILLGTIFAIVMILTLGALLRRQPASERQFVEQHHTPPQERERKLSRMVSGAGVITGLILFALIVISVITGKSIAPSGASNALLVTVHGNQWWWYFSYDNDDASKIVVTANELHIPVGRPVLIRGTSLDVIHSFWVPNLMGKRDLIPSRITEEYLTADRPGRFRGQCAEFCGLEHAKMALWIIAEPPDQFQAWMNQQLQPSVAPDDPDKQRGLQVFLNHECIFCHNINGTPAHGQVAPDLTHLASRSTIAAGTLPNTKGNLAGWIADPQRIKPGNYMATVPLESGDMQPLVDYLESLK
ncbi:MAG: c-type cytochrome [Bryobacterales bacterium]|nr:c-type cytochrome [Bryobacterales bacterium]